VKGRAAVLCLVFVASAAGAGCAMIRFGNPDHTRFQLVPELPSGAAHGAPRYSLLLARFVRAVEGEPAFLAHDSADDLVQRLRSSRVFDPVFAPRQAERAPEEGARAVVEARYRFDEHSGSNFLKALLPGVFAYRLDLGGTVAMWLTVPRAEEPFVYKVSASASRYYYTSGRMDDARLAVSQEVESMLLAALVDELRSDARLRAAP